MNGVKVTYRGKNYIDFIIASDDENLYRYTEGDDKFHKIIGFGKRNFGKAIRGKEREKINELIKIVFENNMPFAIIC